MTDRNVGGLGARVDVVPPQTFERQTGGLGVRADVAVPQGVQFSALEVVTEFRFNPARYLGNLLAMVDYVPSIGPPVGTIRWSASSHAFQLTGSDPIVMWTPGDMFATSGAYPTVIWNDTLNQFEFPP